MRVEKFRSFKGRTIEENQKVKVYKNLHNGLWSIKDHKTNLVLGHAEEVVLSDVTYFVGKGRERVLIEKQKNIHAYAMGNIVGFDMTDVFTSPSTSFTPFKHEAYYNPYKQDHFTKRNTNERIDTSDLAVFQDDILFAVIY